MPVYILRHEQRNPQNPLFESSLTARGLCNAVRLVDKLVPLHIDTIYASPFLRVMQTIYPYCKATQKKVHIENALYESMDSLLFHKHNSSYTWCDLPPRFHDIVHKHNYSSLCHTVKLYESFEDVCERVRPFVEHLQHQQKHNTTDHNVLLVTHLTTANALRHVVDASVGEDGVLEMGGLVRLL
jgi:broad specificity phosphatase PhoE